MRIDDDAAVGAGQQRVAVRCRLGDRFRCEIAVGAGPVLDHDRLAERLRHRLRDETRHEVGRAARRDRNE
jgi:hypothetical protein